MSTQLMSQRDRTELRRILNARFQLLHEQVYQREQELQRKIENEIRTEYEAQVKAAQKKADKLQAKLEKLQAEAEEIETEMAAQGVVPGHGGRRSGYPLFTYTLQTEWQPSDLAAKIKRAYSEITEAAGYHKIDLRLQQLQLEEELAIGALGSDEARQFLGKVPTIDTLLPLDDASVKALTEGRK